MATDLERLVLAIEANTSGMERSLKKLQGTVDKAMSGAAGSTGKLNSALDATAAKAESTGARLNKSLAANKFNTANVAAQFNDIGVQLAAGTSPFLIAIQQGTQLNQILGQAGTGGALKLLSGAFLSLLNPISLATIAVIGLGGAAVQYFAESWSQGKVSEETLKKQADLIKTVADKWGDALPALKAYADEQQKIADQADKVQASNIAIEKTWLPIREQVKDLSVDVADLFSMIQQTPQNMQAIVAFQQAFKDLQTAVESGKSSSEDVRRVQDALANLFTRTSIPAVNDLAGKFGALADSLDVAAEKTRKLAEEQAALAGPIGGETVAGGKSTRAAPLSDANFAARTGWEDYFNFAKPKKAAKAGKSDAEKAQERIDNVTEALKFEQQQLGRTSLEQEIYNQLKAAGVDRDSEAGRQIESLVTSLDSQQKALQASADAAAFFQDTLGQAFDALLPQIKTGNDALDNLLNTLLKVTAQAVLFGSGPLAGLFGGGTGLIGSLFGGIKFATGGMVRGAGTSTSDSVPALLSNGEYVISAEATRKHRRLLEAINNGNALMLASGGPVSSLSRINVTPPPLASAGPNRDINVTVGVAADANGNLMPFVQSVARGEAATAATRVASAVPQIAAASQREIQTRRIRPQGTGS